MVLGITYVNCFRFSDGDHAICRVTVTGACVICKAAVTVDTFPPHTVYHAIGDCVIRGVSVTAATAADQAGYNYYKSFVFSRHGQEYLSW